MVSDNIRNTDTTEFAHVLLPAAAWGEKDGTVTNSERRISRQRAFLPLPGDAKPDWWIVNEVAKRMGFASAFDYAGPDAVFREHAELSAFENGGTRDFNLTGLMDMDADEYNQFKPVQWPFPSKHKTDTARMFANGRFFTPSGKARMLPIAPRAPAHQTCDASPLVFNTGRIRDQWHTMTRTGKTAKLLAHIEESFVEMHPQDMQHAHLQDGQLATIHNEHGEMLARVKASPEQRPGSVFSPIHWSRQFTAKGRVGVLINAVTDPISGQPEFKHAPVNVQPFPAEWHGFVISRKPFPDDPYDYWARIPRNGYWRHELADAVPAGNWSGIMRQYFSQDGDWIEMKDSGARRYRSALLVDGRLEALCFFERDATSLPPRHWLESLFEKNKITDADRITLLTGRPGKSTPDAGRIICACFGVGETTLLEAIANGVDSVEALGIKLKAGTNCGSCIPELKSLLSTSKVASEKSGVLEASA